MKRQGGSKTKKPPSMPLHSERAPQSTRGRRRGYTSEKWRTSRDSFLKSGSLACEMASLLKSPNAASVRVQGARRPAVVKELKRGAKKFEQALQRLAGGDLSEKFRADIAPCLGIRGRINGMPTYWDAEALHSRAVGKLKEAAALMGLAQAIRRELNKEKAS